MTLYWIEILTSIFYVEFQNLPQNKNWPEIAKNEQKSTETLYWIEVLISIFFLLDSRTYHKTSEGARNHQNLPQIAEKARYSLKSMETAITLY